MGTEVFNAGDAMVSNIEMADTKGKSGTTGGNHMGRIDHQLHANSSTYNSL